MMKAFKIIGYILLLILILFLMKFLHSYELLILFIYIIIVPVVMEILFFVFYKKIKYNINSDKKYLTAGDKQNVEISIKSPVILSRLKFDFSVSGKFYDEYNTEFSLSVPAFLTKKIIIPFHFINSGKYNIKIENIVLKDIFGIFTINTNIRKVLNIIVMPKIIENITINSGNTEMDINWAINSYSSDSGDISGVREYIQGDRLNRIHWKASAKTDDIFVKDFEKTGSEECIILFDFIKDYFDKSFDIMYSAGNKILDYKKSFYLMWLNMGSEELSVKFITNKNEFNKAVEIIYNSYPIYKKGLTLHIFKKKFGTSRAIYIGESKELI